MDTNEKLSEHITLGQMTWSQSAGIHVEPTAHQKGRLILLAEMLEWVIAKWGRIEITSGLRNEQVFLAMQDAGYKPSTTSHHFCGNMVMGNITGNGAVDFAPQDAPMHEVFQWIIDSSSLAYEELELNFSKGVYKHIHLALPKFKVLKCIDGKIMRIQGKY